MCHRGNGLLLPLQLLTIWRQILNRPLYSGQSLVIIHRWVSKFVILLTRDRRKRCEGSPFLFQIPSTFRNIFTNSSHITMIRRQRTTPYLWQQHLVEWLICPCINAKVESGAHSTLLRVDSRQLKPHTLSHSTLRVNAPVVRCLRLFTRHAESIALAVQLEFTGRHQRSSCADQYKCRDGVPHHLSLIQGNSSPIRKVSRPGN